MLDFLLPSEKIIDNLDMLFMEESYEMKRREDDG
jgi:hypothetical protein